MKKTINNFRNLVLLILFLSVGCEQGFEDINSKSYAPEKVGPGTLLPTILLSTTDRIMWFSYYHNNELMQYTAINNTVDRVSWYEIRDIDSTPIWDMYSILENVMDMIRISEADDRLSNYLAIGLTFKSLLFQNLTDYYIDIPYSEGLNAEKGILQPGFDTQEVVYKGILEDLERANSLITTSDGLLLGGDILYDGNMLKWKKFINSLRIRYYMRLSKRPEINSGQKISEILSDPGKYPIFEEIDDSATLKYSGVQPFVNRFSQGGPLQFSLHNMSNTLINYLKETNDSRITVYARPIPGATGGIDSMDDYVGLDSGMPFSEVSGGAGNISIVSTRFDAADAPGIIMTYSELQFLLAEATFKNIIAGDSETYYRTGIESNFDFWDIPVPIGFLNGPKIKFDNSLEQIMTQKWVAGFFCGNEAWYDYRRTGYPILHVGQGHQNNGIVPVRFPYPVNVQSLNKANYENVVSNLGGDGLNIKSWWEKD